MPQAVAQNQGQEPNHYTISPLTSEPNQYQSVASSQNLDSSVMTQIKMLNENPGEDCNLSDDEEEKSSNIQTQQKKAFLSMDKIMDRIIKEHEQ